MKSCSIAYHTARRTCLASMGAERVRHHECADRCAARGFALGVDRAGTDLHRTLRASADAGDTGTILGARARGLGGMGVVYAAYDPEMDRRVAIKVLPAGSDASATARLLREARAVAGVSHANVVEVYDIGTFEHRSERGPGTPGVAGLFMVMEVTPGRPRCRISRRGRGRCGRDRAGARVPHLATPHCDARRHCRFGS